MNNNNEKQGEGSACGSNGGSCCGGSGKWILIVLVLAVVGVLIAKNAGKKDVPVTASNATGCVPGGPCCPSPATVTPSGVATAPGTGSQQASLPRLVDLGSVSCIPCKMMAPILDELKINYTGKLDVQFIDVWADPEAGKSYNIKIIPTQIFYDAAGKELFRHEGFFSKEDILAKWKEFGVDLTSVTTNASALDVPALPDVSRWTPARPDTRAKEAICYMCDGDIPSNSLVVVKADKGDVRLCGMHHYFVMYSSLTEDKTGFEKKVSVADGATGRMVPISDATYVSSLDAKTGHPIVKAFAGKEAAEQAQKSGGGEVLDLAALQSRELAVKCGFCDRAVYDADSANVAVIEMESSCCGQRAVPVEWLKACCPMCALGICAKLQKDIELTQKDPLTGDVVLARTSELQFAWSTPSTAVAWYGQRKGKDGKAMSAGCFHQFFFADEKNLRAWLEQHPKETGAMITIQKALSDKMKMTPQQISKACKIGECAPK